MNATMIKAIRNRLGLTQVEFAAVLGTHSITVSKWERGVAQPDAWRTGLLQRMARVEAGEIRRVLVSEGAITALCAALGAVEPPSAATGSG